MTNQKQSKTQTSRQEKQDRKKFHPLMIWVLQCIAFEVCIYFIVSRYPKEIILMKMVGLTAVLAGGILVYAARALYNRQKNQTFQSSQNFLGMKLLASLTVSMFCFGILLIVVSALI